MTSYEEIQDLLAGVSESEALRWACDVAEDAIKRLWTDDSDPRPAQAVEAARAWLLEPTLENSVKAYHASAAAYEAADPQHGKVRNPAAIAASIVSWSGACGKTDNMGGMICEVCPVGQRDGSANWERYAEWIRKVREGQ